MFLQISAQILLSYFAVTETPTTGGLETVFKQSSILFLDAQTLLGVYIALSMKTSLSLHMKSMKTEKGFLPFSSRIFVGFWALFGTLRRTLGILAFFLPTMGLFNILHHIKFEKVGFKIRLDYASTISVEDKIALYGLNETIFWTELDRWNYNDPNKPTPPNYSLYTGLNLRDTFIAFIVLAALQFIAILGANNDNINKVKNTFSGSAMIWFLIIIIIKTQC